MFEQIQIISFYEFKDLAAVAPLDHIKTRLKAALLQFDVRGTIVIANEGFNGMVCGNQERIITFIAEVERILATRLAVKASFHDKAPFRKVDIKIKPEIVTLKKPVNISLGQGTHVKPQDWNSVVSEPGTLLLDPRNSYEHETGTFAGAVDPGIAKFSELPNFVSKNLDPEKHKRVAMFCTGGIRCEKFAPYMRALGFAEVYQLDGGILKYLEEIPPRDSLWEGECFVFDEHTSVDPSLKKGVGPDHSQRLGKRKKELYKVAE